MAAILHPDRLREGFRGAPPDASAARGGWRIAAAGSIAGGDCIVGDDGVPAGVIAVPTEEVLLLLADLPLRSLRRKREALPFAIEDRIADPLDAVHLALGAAVAPDRHLVAIVRHAAMRRWTALAAAAGLERAALVPDALLLPAPDAGRWAVTLDGARAIVRPDDGTGFAVARDQLAAAWAAGGRPALVLHGGSLPADLPAAAEPAMRTLAPRIAPLDLRQGGYAARRPPLPAVGRRILATLAAGLVAHGAIAAADTLALGDLAARRDAQVQALAAAMLPDASPGAGAADAMSLLPAAAPRSRDRLLPLLARVSGVLGATGGAGFRAISYEDAGGTLAIEVASGEERAIAARLAAAGLGVAVAPGRVVVRADGT